MMREERAGLSRFCVTLTPVRALAMASLTLLAACGGGSSSTSSSTSTATVTQAKISGVVAPGLNGGSSLVYAYGTNGAACSNLASPTLTADPTDAQYNTYAVADADGAYSVTIDTSKCPWPITLMADIPDGNDAANRPVAPTREGRKFYNFVSEIIKGTTQYTANLNPSTSLVTQIALGKSVVPGASADRTKLNEFRRVSAASKVRQALDPVASALSLSISDYANPVVERDSPLQTVLGLVDMSIERISSVKQTNFKIFIPSEHRPIVLSESDDSTLDEAFFDTGLGIDPKNISADGVRKAISAAGELKSAFLVPLTTIISGKDKCFLHNGRASATSVFETMDGLTPLPGSSVEAIDLLRYNVYTDFTNETLEKKNGGSGQLAFVALTFRSKQGLKQRAYTWLVQGTQEVGTCVSSGASWRLLGNQHPVYVRTETYAVHETTVSQQFGTRQDKFGSGTEHYLVDAGQLYTHVLISGPGLPSDGVVFIRLNSTHLYSSTSLLALRQSVLTSKTPTELPDSILSTIQDTRANKMTDTSINAITDVFYDARQNQYTYRFFPSYDSLYPTLTITDVLPKRPYLSTWMRAESFPSLAINIDQLSQGLQLAQPVAMNWSLPMDFSGVKAVVPQRISFMRISCLQASKWPSCTNRKDQYAEYEVSPTVMTDPKQTSITITPTPLSSQDYKTNKGSVRLWTLDSLNRPLTRQVGMEYTR